VEWSSCYFWEVVCASEVFLRENPTRFIAPKFILLRSSLKGNTPKKAFHPMTLKDIVFFIFKKAFFWGGGTRFLTQKKHVVGYGKGGTKGDVTWLENPFESPLSHTD